MIRTIIVEDEPVIARGLSMLINQYHSDFQVLAICRNGKDGLKKILEEKPDLIFVDINMPVMNGLKMIEQVQKSGFDTRCVILTGHAEFEYARTAIHLGVSDYLLKPLSPDTLNTIMVSCREQHKSAIRILQKEYLQQHLVSKHEYWENCNPLFHYSCTLLILFFGPICGNIYNETMSGIETRKADRNVLHEMEALYHLSIFDLYGYYHNESIYALVYPEHQILNLDEIARKLYQSFKASETCLHLIISDTITNGENIYDQIRDTHLFALFRNQFGYGSIEKYEPLQNQNIHVSQEIIRICTCIPVQPGQEAIHDFLHSILTYWQLEQVTQFQLVVDLRYFINTFLHDHAVDNIIYPDAEEIVSACQSYRELEEEIFYEIDRVYGVSNEIQQGSQQSLAGKVRDWLDKNFTGQITYKIFQDIFCYNEKYISSLFKAEFGISPSKYISELRLNMAKKLMRNNPDILLKDVAEIVGFSDSFYFSRVFKSHEGISPSNYIKQIKDEAQN